MIRSVDDIHNRHLERKKQNHQIYKTILVDVYKNIDNKDTLGKYNTIYRIPCVVYGNSKYNISTAVHYIIRKLSKGGFVVFPHDNNVLYIDWSILNTKNKSLKPISSRVDGSLKSCIKRV